MKATARLMIAAVLIGGITGPSLVRADAGSAAYYAPSPYRGLRQAMSAAQRDLAKATAAAMKGDAAAIAVKEAQDAVAKSRRDYQDAVAAARLQLSSDPHVDAMRKALKDTQSRMDAQSDVNARLAIASELMVVRNRLNTAEWEVLGVDPDIAVGKAAIADAQRTLQEAQSRLRTAVQNDPAVLAARQRVNDLRRQLRGH